MKLLRRATFEAAVGVLLPLTILLFALGSSSVEGLTRVGGPGRWAALVLLTAAALAAAAPQLRPSRLLVPAWALALAFVALGLVSAAWSVDSVLTVKRTLSVALLFGAGVALALASRDPVDAARRVLRGVLAGAALVAVAGLVLAAVSYDDAVLAATAGAGWRFRGIGQNPNTVAMLLAVVLPVAVWAMFDARGVRRGAAAATALLLAGEIAVSGSRGALVAGFAGALVTAVALADGRARKAAAAAAVVLLGLACTGSTRLQGSPHPETAAAQGVVTAPAPTRGLDAQRLFRLEDELGHPPLGAYRPPVDRTLLGSSGRAQAWDGAVRQAAERPLAGYGFGTEDRVFVDRHYAFEGGFVENTYLGLFLQLGAAGVALFVALLGLLGICALRAARGGSDAVSGPARAAAGVLVGAAAIGLTQSGLLSVGNIAATTIWACLLTLPMLAAAKARP